MIPSCHSILLYLSLSWSILLCCSKECWATEDHALVGDRAHSYSSCRVSNQGTTLRASDLHNPCGTILNHFDNEYVTVNQKSSKRLRLHSKEKLGTNAAV